jgi:hypothetical protein
MNKVILSGRLTADPDIRHTGGAEDLAVARYRLAVDRRVARNADGKQEADFINCVAFGKAGEHMTKYARWNKITKGTGSHESVWKQLMTKATRGQIKNISWKSIGKGITSYGFARGVDKMIKEGLKEVKEGAKEYAIKKGRELFDMLKSGLGATSAMGAVKSLDYLSCRKMSAACPAAGM